MMAKKSPGSGLPLEIKLDEDKTRLVSSIRQKVEEIGRGYWEDLRAKAEYARQHETGQIVDFETTGHAGPDYSRIFQIDTGELARKFLEGPINVRQYSTTAGEQVVVYSRTAHTTEDNLWKPAATIEWDHAIMKPSFSPVVRSMLSQVGRKRLPRLPEGCDWGGYLGHLAVYVQNNELHMACELVDRLEELTKLDPRWPHFLREQADDMRGIGEMLRVVADLVEKSQKK